MGNFWVSMESKRKLYVYCKHMLLKSEQQQQQQQQQQLQHVQLQQQQQHYKKWMF